MDRKRINSSRIRSAGYDPKTQTLEIEFSEGRITCYRGVSPEIHRQFVNAPSPVSFFDVASALQVFIFSCCAVCAAVALKAG